jgi:outer membrane protein OmpA-like peptidoglycan-associated protein
VSVVGPGSGSAAGMTCSRNTVTLSGGDVAFQPDSAVFRDPAAASTTLRPLAQRLRGTGVTATLTGTTADVGDADGQRRLSRERAEAVAGLLRDLGVPADRLTVVGLGSDFPGHVEEHDEGGNLLPAAAALNRKVVIQVSGRTATVCG